MTEAQFDESVRRETRALSRMPGPGDSITWPACTSHPNDPRSAEDRRGFDNLDPSEQRQIIETGLADRTMTQADVVDQLMMALDDARILRMRCGALEAVRPA